MIRVFPRRTLWTPTDSLAFIGDPPLFRPKDSEVPVSVSVVFTWDIAEGKRLARAWSSFYQNVSLGGPAFGDPGGDFTPGKFIKPGVTFTSRGCPKTCSFCLVPKREGALREIPIKEGWIIQDNNLLACSFQHFKAVIEMLSRQRRGVVFSGGLDAEYFHPWHWERMEKLRLAELWFACDSIQALNHLERVSEMISVVPIRKKRCYCLIGRENLQDAEERLERVFALGFLPFAQLYRTEATQSPYSPQWKALARKWSRPAAYRPRKEK